MQSWTTRRLDTVGDVLGVLIQLKGKRWLSRGQSRAHGNLRSSLDRRLEGRSREEKLRHERSAIDLFRHTVRNFADEGEKGAMTDDIIALMVLQHYGFPTRLLDWSFSPYVATFFAVSDRKDDAVDGELWSFDEPRYEVVGLEQWEKWTETKNRDGDFQAGLTAFTTAEPPDWVIMSNYPSPAFPRQFAQSGTYTLTAQFDRDHAAAISALFSYDSPNRCHRYSLASGIKVALRRALREDHGVWRGSLFPDAAGAAHTALLELERNLEPSPGVPTDPSSRQRP